MCQRTVVFAILAFPAGLFAGSVTGLNSFSNGTVADADAVNANFSAIATAVDDNDARITTNSASSADHGARLTAAEADLTDHDARIGTNTVAVTSHGSRLTAAEIALDDHDARITANASAGTTTAADLAAVQATARTSGTYVYRGSYTLVNEAMTVTVPTTWQTVGSIGNDIRGAVAGFPSTPNSTRVFRIRTLYTDNLQPSLCGNGAYGHNWRLKQHDSTVEYGTWDIPGTFSGSGLSHSRASGWIDWATINDGGCDAGWSGGSCQLQMQPYPNCTSGEILVQHVSVEVYDIVD
jgi:hypothetical protein